MCSSVAFSMRALPLFRHVRVFNGTRFSTCRTRGHCCHSPRTISTRLQPKAVPQQHQERAAEREDQGLAQRTIVLGIESSCDDTGAAVVTSSGRLLGEAVAHQHEVHRDFGGVVPMLAREAHVGAIDRVVDEALRKAGVTASDLSAVAVTIGPGLSLCLNVGVRKARQMSARHGIPVVPVHHMEAHALVARMPGLTSTPPDVSYPFLCALVSGGHNLLLLVRGIGNYTILGSTLDDALGEAFDKVARLLHLGLEPSGGAVVEAVAREGDPTMFPFTIPLQGKKPTADFSFSGLKTAVRLAAEANLPEEGSADWDALTPEQEQARRDIAAGFQKTALQHLVIGIRRGARWAMEEEEGIGCLVVAGGVAANQRLREELGALSGELGLRLVVPPARYCTDNGVMVAWAGVERLRAGLVDPPAPTEVPLEGEWVDLRPRWPLGGRHESATGVIRSTKKKKVHPDLTVCTREAARSTVEAAESLGLIDILGIGARAAGVADAEGRQEGGDAVGRMEELAGAVMGAEEGCWRRVCAAVDAIEAARGLSEGEADAWKRLVALRGVAIKGGE